MNPDPVSEPETVVNDEEIQQLMHTLPKDFFLGTLKLINFGSFWFTANTNKFKSTLMFQRNFRARDNDLIITSLPKTGTTWLKSLLYTIVNRFEKDVHSTLMTHHPHELVRRLEQEIYDEANNHLRAQHLSQLPSPRLFNTHLPYSTLPESIKTSSCRILHITRNPLDTLVSLMYFTKKLLKLRLGEDSKLPSVEVYFEDFCAGRIWYGPFFDHVLEYWNKSLEQPNKVLFLKYEDLKEDPIFQVKRIAEFVGMPFSSSEEDEGVVNKVIELCDINNLKELEVNKSGVINNFFDKKSFFRKGEVGDWTNYITPAMEETMIKLMEQKLDGTGLSFQLLPS